MWTNIQCCQFSAELLFRGSQDEPTLLLPLGSVLLSRAGLLHRAPGPPPWGLPCCPWTLLCRPWQPQGAGLILILGSTWLLQHHRGTGDQGMGREIHPPSSFPLSRDSIPQCETGNPEPDSDSKVRLLLALNENRKIIATEDGRGHSLSQWSSPGKGKAPSHYTGERNAVTALLRQQQG